MRVNRCLRLTAGVSLLAASTLAAATAQRTFVSATGVDNPNCSIAAPCRSFASAIIATNAGGEVIVQDSAGYGRVTITKSVSIIAPPGIYAGISVFPGFDGVNIDAPGAIVVLRGLSINGQGGANGILFQQGSRVRIENCVVSGMGAVGIYHQANTAEMIVLDTIVRDNHDGIGLVAADAVITLDRVRSEHNLAAGFYAAPVPGAAFVHATISDSLFAHNGGNGIWADSVGSAQTIVDVERAMVASNLNDAIKATAGAAGSLVSLRVTRSTFTGNIGAGVYALGILPAQVYSHVSENSVGNSISADGSGSAMRASGNMGNSYLGCFNGATLRSFGDNHVNGLNLGVCNFSVIGAF